MSSGDLPLFYDLMPTVQHYSWGSRSPDGMIARFLKKRGITVQTGVPLAEVWMGAHASSPSHLVKSFTFSRSGGFSVREISISLADLIRQNPLHALGEELIHKGYRELPFLFKILDAARALSIQTHPDKKTARRLHAEDPEHYPDPNHKPELVLNAGGMRALIGFRKEEEIARYLGRYPHILGLCGSDNSDNFIKLFNNLMLSSPQAVEECTAIHRSVLAGTEPSDEADLLFTELLEQYDASDPGLYCVYFMNYLRPALNEGYFLNPGVLHAYISGSIIECMASSDNVIRAGLTPKYRDTRTLLSVLDRNTGKPSPVSAQSAGEGLFEFKVPETDFRLYKAEPGKTFTVHPDICGPAILLLLEGNLSAQCEGHTAEFSAGTVLFLPGDPAGSKIQCSFLTSPDGLCFIAAGP